MSAVISDRLISHPAVAVALAGVGSVWLAHRVWRTTQFVNLHYVRQSQLDRYRSGENSAWALVTGASDGIGKGFAEELCQRGFDVVLHGRNEKKLLCVRDELQQQWPTRKFRILVLDAVEHAGDLTRMRAAVDELKDLNLRILVNNVGGAAGVKPLISPFQDSAEDAARIQLDLNVRFQTELTRLLLPQLIAKQPSSILNIGSASADIACCYLSIASAVKAYQKAWSRSLGLELKAEGHDVEVLYYKVAMVSSGSSPRPTSLFIPSSRRMAAACLEKVGCGRDVVYGYWPHELQFGLVSLLPTFVAEKVMITMAKGEMAKEQKALKAQY